VTPLIGPSGGKLCGPKPGRSPQNIDESFGGCGDQNESCRHMVGYRWVHVELSKAELLPITGGIALLSAGSATVPFYRGPGVVIE